MDTKKGYKIYWREFNNYRGSKMGFKSNTGRWEYGNFPVYKFGYEQVGKDRVEMNEMFEKENKWVDLWEDIKMVDSIEFFVTRETVLELEKQILKHIGGKDFWMEEKISGLSEFRLKTKPTFNKASEIFAELREYANIYNRSND